MRTADTPHVDPAWAEALLLELRLLDVPGTTIGAVLAEVESHCAESGQDAPEAFGDAVAYARSLDLPTRPSSATDVVRSAVPTLVQVAGTIPLVHAYGAWRSSESVTVTVGQLVSVAVGLALVVIAVRHLDTVLRTVVRRPVVAWLALTGGTMVLVLTQLLLTGVVGELPAGPTALASAAVLAAGVVWAVLHARLGADPADPVVAPLDDAESVPIGGRSTLLVRATAAVVPVWTLVLLGLTWWTTR
ncbi:hypothetical protein ACTHAM_001766 [Cellulomonas soli]|uniref:hypothetical protein n=1 Tax=Cellulomonas soli TaxID=931535 RepID=UPI003F84CB23